MMGRSGPLEPAKATEAKPPAARKSPKNESARVRDLDKRLEEALMSKADALKREAEGLKREETSPTCLSSLQARRS
jgi:hypothetical protein